MKVAHAPSGGGVRRFPSRSLPSAETSHIRERLMMWREHHFSLSLISLASGVSVETLSEICEGNRRVCFGATELAIMSISPSQLFASAGERTRIPIFATRRRFEALVAAGWSSAQMDRLAVVHKVPAAAQSVSRLRSSALYTTRQNHDTIKFVYENAAENLQKSNRVIGFAHERDWLPPQAWEGVDIDDPLARPRVYWGRRS